MCKKKVPSIGSSAAESLIFVAASNAGGLDAFYVDECIGPYRLFGFDLNWHVEGFWNE
jgi:hypothetical protein